MSLRALLLLALSGCGSPSDDTAEPDDDTAEDTGGTRPPELVWEGACPQAMVQVGTFCIDAYEPTIVGELGYADQLVEFPGTATVGWATSEAGVVPTAPTSWYQARGACLNAGKHLCTVPEWQAACGAGPFPWGDEPRGDEVCALPGDDGTTTWDELQPTGSLPDCRSPSGIFDQVGNAWEWADPGSFDESGEPSTAKLGGAYYAGQGNATCGAEYVDDHAPWFEGTIAGRCCIEARP